MFTALALPVRAGDDTGRGKLVLTSLEPVYSITARLCRSTALKAARLFPEGVRMESQARHVNAQKDTLAGPLKQALAVVSLRSAWPGDPLYPSAREQNIGVIEIDGTMPFDRKKAGVPLLDAPVWNQSRRVSCTLLWLSLSNASRMADIIAGDLMRLSPGEEGIISQNLKAFKQDAFKLRSTYESRFAQLDSLEAIAMTGDFVYLTQDFNIDIAQYFLKPEIDWAPEDLAMLKQTIEDNAIKAVIHKWTPDPKIMAVIQASGARLAVLDAMDPGTRGSRTGEADTYLAAMRQNLTRLAQALE